jgi:uncharacterized protein (DUF58 family)
MGKDGKIYIIPTRFGITFLVGIITMLLVGATYSNNLVNLLAFFLLAIALVAMVQTHNNLKNVRLQLINSEPGFAGATVTLTAALENTGQEARFNLNVRPARLDLDRDIENLQPLQAGAVLRLRSTYRVSERGQYELRRIKISTIFPVGLFRAWMWYRTDSTYIVYPTPRGRLPLPEAKFEAQDGPRVRIERGGDDFSGHRRFNPGDSARRVDWKAYARGRPMMIKEFDDGNPQALLFDYSLLPNLPREERLATRRMDRGRQATAPRVRAQAAAGLRSARGRRAPL